MNKIVTSFFIFSWLIAGSVFAATTPNDPYYNKQWYLQRIEADKAWSKINSTPYTIIAVIDSGIQINHPDLEENIWVNKKEIIGDGIDNDNNGFIDDINGWDFAENNPNPSPKIDGDWTESGLSHGTLVAGIIAARGNNAKGVSGLTWNAKIMPLKALNDRGEGKISDVIRAIDYATSNGAHIINLSFSSLNYSEGLQDAIYRAHRAGVMIVAAAGNEQASGKGYDIDRTKLYPACYDGPLIGQNMVIGVAATDALDQKTNFSSYGSSCVDISAPGISFFNTVSNMGVEGADKDYDGYFSGTSMAAPLVSAALALIQEANPELSRREVVNILFASSDNIDKLNPGYEGKLGNGRLNINRAVEMAREKLLNYSSHLIIAPGKEMEVNEGDGESGDDKDVAKSSKIVSPSGSLDFDLPNNILDIDKSFASGDVSGNGQEEIVVAADKGDRPNIKVYNLQGHLVREFPAYEEKYKLGVNVAVFDMDGDGQEEILTALKERGEGEIKIFDYSGNLKKIITVVEDKAWRGGLQIAVGDIDGKGSMEIVVAFGAGSEPQVRIFNSEGKLLGVFLAYEKSFRGGVNLAVANINGRVGRNLAEIITSPGPGREPEVKIFSHRAKLLNSFNGYSKNWQKGVALSAGDINSDGMADIILSAYPGGAPHVRVFDSSGIILESFYAYNEGFINGVKAGIIKIRK